MNADTNRALIRLQTEIDLLKGALNLSRERAEDAESDLAEARAELAAETIRADKAERAHKSFVATAGEDRAALELELQNQTNRAKSAEWERDEARVEAMGHARELEQFRHIPY